MSLFGKKKKDTSSESFFEQLLRRANSPVDERHFGKDGYGYYQDEEDLYDEFERFNDEELEEIEDMELDEEDEDFDDYDEAGEEDL